MTNRVKIRSRSEAGSPPEPEATRVVTTQPSIPVYEDETIEPLLFLEGKIIQKRRGYRFSVDAVLLAAMAAQSRCAPGARYLDLGTGCGIIPVLLSRRYEDLRGYGVEIQPSLSDLARRNLALHGVDDRIQVLCMDLGKLPDHFPQGSFDWITSNPPYRKVTSGRINPDPQKAVARHELHTSLGDILGVAAHLLRKKGRLFMIYPASRLAELTEHLRQGGLTPKRLRPVYPAPDLKATRILVEAILGGGDELGIERPLFLKDRTGEYTEEVLEIYHGFSA